MLILVVQQQIEGVWCALSLDKLLIIFVLAFHVDFSSFSCHLSYVTNNKMRRDRSAV